MLTMPIKTKIRRGMQLSIGVEELQVMDDDEGGRFDCVVQSNDEGVYAIRNSRSIAPGMHVSKRTL